MLDSASLSALVAEHGKWLMTFLSSLAGDIIDAEDAFQETWLRVMRSNSIPAPIAWRAYLVKTARSVIIDKLRKQNREESLEAMMERDDEYVEKDIMSDDAPDPAVRYEARATSADVREAINSLPLNWRQVVLMRIEGEMEFKDIAAELGIPIGTALTWMHNATQALKSRFGGAK